MTPQDEEAARCSYQPGLFSWELRKVRKCQPGFKVRGQLKIFEVGWTQEAVVLKA
jgi:hypothetical protein